ncbi:hypothetical protein D1610_14810 [Sphingomonas gilva]|uniref:Uncharacterized protein n=1 Tax=Sphingomonas gilva TaxID=2305907 RepID=A0A396RKD3_9SPHN|nr:hypothetical protein [Sphingomonas gilva]RHW16660.1 hypothetical protein D1610_14810 [Sphingomonas gilva]
MIWWIDAKTWLSEAIGLDKNFLHVYAGVIGLLALAALLRRPVGDGRALALVTLLEGVNEAIDLYGNWLDDQRLYWDHSLVDALHTLALPLLIVVCARWSRLFISPGAVQSDAAPPASPADDSPSGE